MCLLICYSYSYFFNCIIPNLLWIVKMQKHVLNLFIELKAMNDILWGLTLKKYNFYNT